MALTSTEPAGFRPYKETSGNGDDILWVPGNPGDTYTKNDLVGIGGVVSESSVTAGKEGVLILDADIDKNAIGSVDKTTVCPAAATPFAQAFNSNYPVDPVYDRSSLTAGLVPVRINCAAGIPIMLVKFANHVDDTVASYAASTRSIQATTGHTADNYSNGSLIYIYSGPGAGELNVIEDYDHAGGNVAQEIITHRKWNATLTTASKYIVLTGEAAANRGISLFGRIDREDSDNLTAADGANDGDYIVFGSWNEIAWHMQRLQLPVIDRRHMYE